MRKLSADEIRELVSSSVDLPESVTDEMALPSYLHRNPLIPWLMWRRYECVEKLSRLSAGMNVLEFGCGIGLFLPTLCDAGRTVYAIDLFPEYAKALAARLDLRVTFAERVSDLPDASLDLVIAADVLEHLDRPGDWVTEIGGKLRPQGRLIVSGPTESVIYKIGRLVAGFGDKGDYHHWNIYELMTLITERGFRLASSRSLPYRIPPFLFQVCEYEYQPHGASGDLK